MRVLMVSKACLVGTYQTKLTAIARQQGVELAVIVPPSWRDPAGEIVLERAHTAGYQLWVEPMRFNGQFHFHYYPTLGRRLRQFRPHILHMDEEPYNLATWLAFRQAAQVGAKKLFFTWQNICRTYPLPFRWLEAQVLRQADYALMGNQAAVDVFHHKGYTGPYKVIPQFGVAADLFTPPPQRHAEQRLIIGAAGRFVPEKGWDVLLAAVALLQGEWVLQMAGAGPERPRLEAMTQQLGIAQRVQWVGAHRSAEMPAFLQGLDVLVLPSRTMPNWKEQFGRILIEAMACETAVIGSDSGEIPHVIGTAGLTFPEDNAPALAHQLQLFLQNPAQRQTLGRAGRQRVLTHYTQEQIAQQTAAVYEELRNAERGLRNEMLTD